jgi:hypothetical protein
VLDSEQVSDKGMPAGLLDYTISGINEYERKVCGRRPGYHVPGVLNVSGGVGDDELALWCGKVTIGNVNGYALFAFGTETIGKQGQIDVVVPSLLATALDRLQLILKDRLGVMKEPANEGALSVVHASRGGKPEEVHVQVIVFFRH